MTGAAVALEWASTSDVLKMLKYDSFSSNTDFSYADFTRSKDIYGSSCACAKGKTRVMSIKTKPNDDYIKRTILAYQVLYI